MDRLKVILGALVFLFSSIVNSAIISVDDSIFGTDSVTRDTDSRLEWLDLTLSIHRSYNDVRSQLGIGGDYEGWRYATGVEFNELVSNFTGETVTVLYGWTYQEPDKIDGLINLLGSTLDVYYLENYGATYDQYHSYEEGQGIDVTTGLLADVITYTEPAHYTAEIYDDDRYDDTSHQDLSGIFIRTIDSHVRNGTGSFLVRSIPEPSIIILMFTGLLGLGLARRQKGKLHG